MAHLTEDDITAIVNDMRADAQFSERNAEYVQRREYLNRQRKPKVPGLDLQAWFGSPKFRMDAHRYQDKLIGAPFSITVAAQAEKPRAAERAQRYENLAYRLIHRWKASGVFHRALFDMISLGRGELHLFINRAVFPLIPQPEAEDMEDPARYVEKVRPLLKEFASGERADLIDCEYVPADAVYWSPDRTVKAIVARVPLGTLQEEYGRENAGGYAGAKGKSKAISVNDRGEIDVRSLDGAVSLDSGTTIGRRHVTLWIVETDEYCYHVLHDGFPTTEQVRGAGGRYTGGTRPAWRDGNKMHLLGCYKNYFGRPAIFDVNGRPTGEDHALHGHSALIEGLYATEPLRQALGSLMFDAGFRAAQQQRTLIPQRSPEAAEERNKQGAQIAVREIEGGYRVVSPGWEIAPMVDTLSVDVINAFSTIAQESDLYGFPRVLAAPEELDAKSGYDRAKATDAVSSHLDPPLEAWAATLSEMVRAAGTAIKTLGVPVQVRNLFPTDQLGPVPKEVQEEIEVKPDDIVDVDIAIEFDAKTQYSKIAEIETGMQLLAQGLMSETQMLTEVLRVDDPDRFRRERLRDRMRAKAEAKAEEDAVKLFERVRSIVSGEALQESGMEQLLAAAMAGQGGGMGEQPMGDPGAVSVPTGPNTAMAPEPSPAPEAELGAAGGQGAYLG